MIITVLLPSGAQATLGVAENTLVFNGQDFVTPEDLQYAELYTVPVQALSMPYRQLSSLMLSTMVKIKALVTAKDPTVVPTTDTQLVAADDPTLGQCLCGLTCSGVDLRFVTVSVES